MKVLKNHIRIGIEKPFTVLHASDTHIAYADNRNDERKIRLARERTCHFSEARDNLEFIKNLKDFRDNL